jgi:DnaJ-domain-containing protein 1
VDDWYWFCLVHVRDYNARWNYYANMSETQIEQERRADVTWQRPSWPLGAFPGAQGAAQPFQDPFGLFQDAPSPSQAFFQSGFSPRSPEGKALAVLGLSYPFSHSDLQKNYRALVKKHHPDANGGSLEAEEALKRINEAYAVLKGGCG